MTLVGLGRVLVDTAPMRLKVVIVDCQPCSVLTKVVSNGDHAFPMTPIMINLYLPAATCVF